MLKNKLKIASFCLLITLSLSSILGNNFAFAENFVVSTNVVPLDATAFTSTINYNPGAGECELTWTTSQTPNISNQRIYIDDGTTISSILLAFPGSLLPDTTILNGLIPNWTYTLRLVSEAGTLESPGVWAVCTPMSAIPAPDIVPEPATTIGTENEIYWTNGDTAVNPDLTCRVERSTDMTFATLEETTAWTPCPDHTITYSHNFTGLTINEQYYYRVQAQDAVDGLSPYSLTVTSQQISAGGVGGGGGGSSAACGNAILETGEQCDDGNRTPGDGCNEFCSIELAVCGDGVVETPETCDDGNTTSGDGCSNICLAEAPIECGNAVLETGEQCDDGNLLNNDGCSNICTFEVPEFCGDGLVQAPEQCDDNNNTAGDGCSPICEVEHAAAPVCGDAFREDPEQCDDGNLINGDGCTSACTLEALPTCGNAIVESPEACDDGNLIDDDGCSAICELEPLPACGNAILEAPEECDDGNLLNFDGCDEFCVEEEIVEVYLHVTGAPEHRITEYYNLPEDERPQPDSTRPSDTNVVSEILSFVDFGAADLSRIQDTPNLGLNSELLLFKPAAGSLDSVSTTLDNFGKSWVAVEVITGSYDFTLNGEAHLNRVLQNIVIDGTMDGEIVELDFTKTGTQKSIPGDVHKNNYINALDIATMLGSYKATGTNINDLNKDESPIVNAIDIAILLWNYKKTGESWQSVVI